MSRDEKGSYKIKEREIRVSEEEKERESQQRGERKGRPAKRGTESLSERMKGAKA